MIHALAAFKPGGKLKSFEYEPGALREEEVEINVEFCGVCRSDLMLLDNERGGTKYPLVPGHEVIGTISAVGSGVDNLKVSQRVGLGWYSGSCMICEWCEGGHHNFCRQAEQTIVGRHGGFAEKVRAHKSWVFPIPDRVESLSAGPLFCGGITVFNPIIQFDVQPKHRVGIIGIGGLGHLAIQFFHAWGCEVTAFSSNPNKEADAKELGADHFVNSRSSEAIKAVEDSFDLIVSTVNADLDWRVYIKALRPLGRLHFVGGVPNPICFPVLLLLDGQKSVSGSPVGSPNTISKMLDFVEEHQIKPVVEVFSFAQVNEALDKLRSGKVRYRLILEQ
ncbi:MAG: NAD(P)-dependent alcohol dehydrogenase [Cyanobacteria bacterium P01_A01_bin.68]